MKSGKSLVELAQAIERQRGLKRDFIADTRHLRMQPTDRGPALIVEERGYPLTRIAHQQLGERVGIPAKYYERMRSDAPELLARNVNHWFGQAPERRMVRTLGGDARAFLSDRYRTRPGRDRRAVAGAVEPGRAPRGVVRLPSLPCPADAALSRGTRFSVRRCRRARPSAREETDGRTLEFGPTLLRNNGLIEADGRRYRAAELLRLADGTAARARVAAMAEK